MNYLAHLYLSGSDTELILGNFMADHLKGAERHQVRSEKIQKGILLHRHIDSFTDNHPIVAESKARVRTQFGKYAPVIVDVFYDHFLAARWEKFHHESLHDFSSKAYALLQSQQHHLPTGAQYMLPYMIKHDWLNGYAVLSGVQRVMEGMNRRSNFISHMDKAPAFLMAHYEEFGAEFELFFPELRSSCADFLCQE